MFSRLFAARIDFVYLLRFQTEHAMWIVNWFHSFSTGNNEAVRAGDKISSFFSLNTQGDKDALRNSLSITDEIFFVLKNWLTHSQQSGKTMARDEQIWGWNWEKQCLISWQKWEKYAIIVPDIKQAYPLPRFHYSWVKIGNAPLASPCHTKSIESTLPNCTEYLHIAKFRARPHSIVYKLRCEIF